MRDLHEHFRRRFRLTVGCWVLLAGQACGGTPAAFGPMYPDNRPAELHAMLQRVAAAAPRKPTSVAVGAAPKKLYAYDVASRQPLWQHALALTSSPHLAGDSVVVQVGESIFGFDQRSGKQRFEIDAGQMSLRGVDGEGELVALVLSRGEGTLARAEAVLVRDGSIRWRRSIEGQGGVPALSGSVVLVPWSSQFLSALDVDGGHEFARLRVRDGVISHALNVRGTIYIGSFHGLNRLTTAVATGKLRGPGRLELPERELPGRPLLLPDVYAAPNIAHIDSAQHRIGLSYMPLAVGRDRIGLEDDNLYSSFYRIVYALDRSAVVRWVYVHDADIVGIRAQRGGLWLGDERGRLVQLDAASGVRVWSATGAGRSTVLRLPETGIEPDDQKPAHPPGTLRSRLLAAIQHPDARLAPARVFAVQQLSALSEPEVGGDLVAICDADMMAPPVRERACFELRRRPNAAAQLMSALTRHAGHIEGTTSPQVGALASAAASIELTRAVPLLVTHLQDPATRSSDLPALITALGDLGDASAGEPLARFIALYHADPIDSGLVRALELAPAALVKLKGAASRPLLSAVARDELGVYSLRQAARASLDVIARQEAAARSVAAPPAPASEAPAPEATPEVAQEPPPARLTPTSIDAALLPVRDRLQACLKAHSVGLLQARVLLVIEDGRAKLISVIPAGLQPCIEPLIRGQEFPKTLRGTPERLTYILKR